MLIAGLACVAVLGIVGWTTWRAGLGTRSPANVPRERDRSADRAGAESDAGPGTTRKRRHITSGARTVDNSRTPLAPEGDNGGAVKGAVLPDADDGGAANSPNADGDSHTALAEPVAMPGSAGRRKVSVALDEVTFGEALRSVCEEAGLELQISEDIPQQQLARSLSITLAETPMSRALQILEAGSGVALTLDGSCVRVQRTREP